MPRCVAVFDRLDDDSFFSKELERLRISDKLRVVKNAVAQGIDDVVFFNGNDYLPDNRARDGEDFVLDVNAYLFVFSDVGNEVNGAARFFDAAAERRFMNGAAVESPSAERGKQGRVNVQDAVLKIFRNAQRGDVAGVNDIIYFQLSAQIKDFIAEIGDSFFFSVAFAIGGFENADWNVRFFSVLQTGRIRRARYDQLDFGASLPASIWSMMFLSVLPLPEIRTAIGIFGVIVFPFTL